jgi:hypothetical protein
VTTNPLLDIIAGREHEGYFEIRCPGIPFRPEFVPVQDRDRMNARCQALSARTDVFIGAAVRARRGGGKADIDRVSALWVDCDVEKGSHRLSEFPHPPTLEIASGSPGNIHAWWALDRPIPAVWAATALRRLVHHLGSDPAVKDVARIMRPPGSLNHKHDPPRRVEVVEHRDVRYSAADLVGDIPDPQPSRPKSAEPRRADPVDDLERIPVEAYYSALTGWDPSGRHVACPFWPHRSNPAMKLYPETDTWACFACPAGGDVYEFGARLWEMDRRSEFVELRRRLCDKLGVNG